ncbi:hypothetical protein [Pseudoroseomonas cervicalis]|uniref:hypothetical protein n=1 Tax=Teichococcus cervicalis TaxID=204525 RepID=UPI002788918A|nr:hypothetical protein [Pseudoroseomonas cervicalis]MDQ1081439.1 hypothetical protein [Pseudoroseomonas cervicalis]
MAKQNETPDKPVDQNATASPSSTETLNPAGTAPKDPDQATVAAAHAKHEEQKALAERVEAAKWDGVRAGLTPTEALAKAQREVKAEGAAPENKGA